ncbi:MAG: copper-translocating P-type ATPase [Acidobacteria bacterium]|nr:copper-translocating P-type ATPase [Acidobacteriota bacterium]
MTIPNSSPTLRVLDLNVSGMTCASCVARVEKKLGKLEGVSASVNLPLESARVMVPEGITDQEIVETVNATGYKASIKRAPAAPAAVHPAHQHGSAEAGHDHGSMDGMDPNDHMNHGGTAAALRPRLIVAAVLTTPLFLLSMIEPLHFTNWGWLALVLATPVVTWAAWPFHRAAAINARHGASTMDTLVSIGVTAAFLYSLVSLLLNPGMGASMAGHAGGALYFEVAAVVTTFLLLGRYLEANAKAKAGDALKSLLNLGVKDATVLRGYGTTDVIEEQIPISQLVVGDVFVTRPGEKVATDGLLLEGESAIDSSLITGESLPVEVSEGAALTGATLNTTGRLVVRATRVGQETTLAQMGRLVSDAQSGKAPIARLADRISAVFVPVVLGIAVLTFVLWLIFTGDLTQAFTAAVAVLVIACPCALGLATPVGLLTGTGRGAMLGILIKGPAVLEDTRTVDTIVLDKTGTVTSGSLSVERVIPLGSMDEAEVLAMAGAVEAHSEHPVGAAIAASARASQRLAVVSDFQSAPGGGVRATVNGHVVVVGRDTWLRDNQVVPTARELDQLQQAEASGATAVWVAIDNTPAGIISLKDTVKDGSANAIAALKNLGLRPYLVTGDNAAVAATVAAAVGIDVQDVRSGVHPQGKVAVIRELQAAGATVAMAGDGVNDAAALAQADLGIAMGSGTDVAIEAADITVMGSSLGQVATAIELSRATLRIIKTNLFWAFAYNVIGIPVAAFGLLNPMIAGAAMAASSVLVVANSLRLRRFTPTRHDR